MMPFTSARLRLASLWVSQVARVMADNALRLYVVLHLARAGTEQQAWAWHLVTFIFLLPAVILAPINGAICNSLPKGRVLLGAAIFGLSVVIAFGNTENWLVVWSLMAFSSSVYGPTRSAILPAAATDSRWPLTRINGFFEMGAAAAVVGGMILTATLEWEPPKQATHPDIVSVILLLHMIAVVAALAVRFRSDVRRPEYPLQAARGFFKDFARIWSIREARACLVGLATLRGVAAAMMGALLPMSFANSDSGLPTLDSNLIVIGVAIFAGVGLGSLLAGVQRHPRRVLGLVPIGAVGLTIGLAMIALGVTPGTSACVLLGIMVGLINVPLAADFQALLPEDARGNGMALRNFSDYTVTAAFSLLLFSAARFAGVSSTGQFALLAGLTFVAAITSAWYFRRELVEQMLEILLWPLYRIRTHGPGLASIPMTGPVLVVANHAAWLDPLWLGKVMPRRMIPMMTSTFYDAAALRWLMVHIAKAIRVEASTFRRDVPELREAVATLDRGECLVLFPEGAMRKREDQPLRMFGQGVWHILSERPETPVVVCWIEGNWGSYFSYKGGPPTKKKPFDFWRHIDIGIDESRLLPADILADQRGTRLYLMRECLQARRFIGLEPLNANMEEAKLVVGEGE